MRESLPPGAVVRWTPRRKAQIVAAIDDAELSFADACARYDISPEELLGWQRAVRRSGMAGLRTTRLQEYREPLGSGDCL